MLQPTRFLDDCQRRYGDFFTVQLTAERTVVISSDPQIVKDVFTGDPEVLRAGEGNIVLRPLLGPRSVLLLDGPEHLRHRRLMLPPFHGERMNRYGAAMAEAAERHVERWPVGSPFATQPSMQAITLEVILRAVFGVEDEQERERIAAPLRRMLDATASRLRLLLPPGDPLARRRAAQPVGPVPGPDGARGPRDLRADRGQAGGSRRGRARRRAVPAARGARRGRPGAHRRRAARRADDAAARRPRDHGHRAQLDARAHHSPPGGAGSAARGGAERRRRLPRRGDQGDAPPASRGPGRGQVPGRGRGAGRPHVPGRRPHHALDLPAAPAPRPLSRPRVLPARALPGASPGHLRVDPVRRRRAPLPRRELRPVRDEGRARRRSSGARGSPPRRRARSRSPAAPSRSPPPAAVASRCSGSGSGAARVRRPRAAGRARRDR